MCGRTSKGGVPVVPGTLTTVYTPNGPITMKFGFDNGRIYNARFEKLGNIWRPIASNRCILEVDSFYEGKVRFSLPDSNLLLGGIYSRQNEFALITIPANWQVSKYHHRMPLIVNNFKEEFLAGAPIEFEASELPVMRVLLQYA